MTLWFYSLWLLALVKVVTSPFSIWLRKILWIAVISIGAWLIIGALTYQSQHALYLVRKNEYEQEKIVLRKERERLDLLFEKHPTSRDVLLQLALLSYQLGEREKLLGFVQSLRDVDPNHEKVKNFLRQIQ